MYSPVVNNWRIAWHGDYDGTDQIYGASVLVPAPEQRLSDGSDEPRRSPQLSGDSVFWFEGIGVNYIRYGIRRYDFLTHVESVVAPTSKPVFLAASGHRLVWTHFLGLAWIVPISTIRALDLSTGAEWQVADMGLYGSISMAGDFAAWIASDEGRPVVLGVDFTDGEVRKLTWHPNTNVLEPSVSHEWVVWPDSRGGPGFQLYAMPRNQ